MGRNARLLGIGQFGLSLRLRPRRSPRSFHSTAARRPSSLARRASEGIRPQTMQARVATYLQCSLSRRRMVFTATRRPHRTSFSPCAREPTSRAAFPLPPQQVAVGRPARTILRARTVGGRITFALPNRARSVERSATNTRFPPVAKSQLPSGIGNGPLGGRKFSQRLIVISCPSVRPYHPDGL